MNYEEYDEDELDLGLDEENEDYDDDDVEVDMDTLTADIVDVDLFGDLLGLDAEEVKKMDSEVLTRKDTFHQIADDLVENTEDFKEVVTKQLEYPYIEVAGLGEKTAIAQIAMIKKYFPEREGTMQLMVSVTDPSDGKVKRAVAGHIKLELKEFTKLMSIKKFNLVQHVSQVESHEITEDLLCNLILS